MKTNLFTSQNHDPEINYLKLYGFYDCFKFGCGVLLLR